MQRIVDSAIGVAKESVKTFTQETFNNIVRFINGISAIVLSFLPGKSSILEGIHGWELKPSFRAPYLPRWMENGVSSFNNFIHEFSRDPNSESENESDLDDNNENSSPPSPCSPVSHISQSSTREEGHPKSLMKKLYGWLLWPYKVVFPSNKSQQIATNTLSQNGSLHRPPSNQGSFMQTYELATRRVNTIRDQMVHRTTDRRRGLIEDLQLLIEVAIEIVFDFVSTILHFVLSPFATCRSQFKRLINRQRSHGDETEVANNTDTQNSSSDDAHSGSCPRQTRFQQSLNTDSRTCEDVIKELGYPYEAIRVTTADGYVLLLERIPRRDSKKVVYLQHGLFDSSLGWVSNGVVGSQAFAAYDQGYDVFLGNFRGLVSREHIDKNISSQRYWRYSINEHATQDIPAMIEKIHDIKLSELGQLKLDTKTGDETKDLPYTISAVSHSLGGAAMLMYVVTRRLNGIPHRLSRLILLSPAGFHDDTPPFFKILENFFPFFAPVLGRLVPGMYIPTRFFRMLFNKLARDLQNYPAIGGLAQTLFSYFVGGDSSNWVGVIATPHYNMNDMPGVAYRVFVHLAQIKRAKKFRMYDFGSARANREAYGTPQPIDIGENYGVIDIPIDLVGGQKDKLIPASMVKKHYMMMKAANVDVSYEEFEYAHLDFTFSHKEELQAYVMSRITQGSASPKKTSDCKETMPCSENDAQIYYERRRNKRKLRRRLRKSDIRDGCTDEDLPREQSCTVSECSSSEESLNSSTQVYLERQR